MASRVVQLIIKHSTAAQRMAVVPGRETHVQRAAPPGRVPHRRRSPGQRRRDDALQVQRREPGDQFNSNKKEMSFKTFGDNDLKEHL